MSPGEERLPSQVLAEGHVPPRGASRVLPLLGTLRVLFLKERGAHRECARFMNHAHMQIICDLPPSPGCSPSPPVLGSEEGAC